MRFLWIIFTCTILFSQELITPIPEYLPHDKQKAALGKRLFFDTILSHDRTISCQSCHNLSKSFSGADENSLSLGIYNQKGTFNTPTVLNAVFNYVQFWSGGVDSLEDQVVGPLHNPHEMGMNERLIILRLNGDDYYKDIFDKLYGSINVNNIADAIAEFEKTLITPNSRFDKYLKGNKKALTSEEIQGYYDFKKVGCIACHNGVNMGGNLVQNFGIFTEHVDENKYYDIDETTKHKHYYKVPSLRNISKTAPYFHDGQVNDLKEAIRTMGHFQIGRKIPEEKVNSIYKFLLTLDGQIPSSIQ